MKNKNFFLGLLITASLFLTISCDDPRGDSENGNGDTISTEVTFESAVQMGGESGTADSIGLTLTFSVDPTTLAAEQITVIGATKGTLSGSGTTRTLAIFDITVGNGEELTVEIANPIGYIISDSPKTVVVYKDLAERTIVTFERMEQTGGASGTTDSTGLTLAFSVDPTTLTAEHITVTGATKGELIGSGRTRTLDISDITVANGESVSVAIANPSGFTISGSPKTAVVYKNTTISPTAITFESVEQVNGTSGTNDTTILLLIFSDDPTTLSEEDITVIGATKVRLIGTGTNRGLYISDITVANGETVEISIANPSGYIINGSPKTAVVYKNTTTTVTFESLEQIGGTSGIVNTTGLLLIFSDDPTTLSEDDITVIGATKGELSGEGTTRTLVISDITVANGGNVWIFLSNPSGYIINGLSKKTVVYKDTTVPPTAVTFEGVEQFGGTSGTTDTMGLTLTFSVDPTTLAASDITVTGATKGVLSGSGTTRTLAISNITVEDGETVTVAISNPSGFTISGSPQTAVIYKGIVYNLRDTGPAGGLIFYINPNYATDGWRYLEAWTSDEVGTYQWDSRTSPTFVGTSVLLGAGYANTYTYMTEIYHPAAAVVRNANHGGYNDWFLPSGDELDLMYENLKAESVGGFADALYWSSYEYVNNSAWVKGFGNGAWVYTNKSYSGRVRAVRAF